ncbi:hypothetical protein [Paenibacillus sonchi]
MFQSGIFILALLAYMKKIDRPP